MEFDELVRLASAGESETIEFKKSTGQLQRAGRLFALFLTGRVGVFFAV